MGFHAFFSSPVLFLLMKSKLRINTAWFFCSGYIFHASLCQRVHMDDFKMVQNYYIFILS